MFTRIRVVGRGRVGSAIAARLHERSLLARDDAGDDVTDLVLLCVPDARIAEVVAMQERAGLKAELR